jgi:hypothetical protein
MSNCAPAKVGFRLVSISKQNVNESVTTPLASPIRSRTPLTRVALHSAARVSTASTILSAMASSCMTTLYPLSTFNAVRLSPSASALHRYHPHVTLDIGKLSNNQKSQGKGKNQEN